MTAKATPKPTIVMLPGLGCDRRLWDGVEPKLLGSFQLLHPPIWGARSLADAARRVVSLLDHLGTSRVGVVGLSMGGYVAFELLAAAPERVGSAAFLDTTCFPDPPERRDKRHQVLRLLESGRFEEVLAAYAGSVLAPGPAQDRRRDRLLAMGRALGSEVFAADTRAILERPSYETLPARAKIPLLFAAGEHDALTPPEVAEAMARKATDARLEILRGAGHMSPLETPERLAEVLWEFFMSVDRK